MRNPFKLLVREPHYILGRFWQVRSAYARVQRVRQHIGLTSSELRIGDLYARESLPLAVRDSGTVISACDKATHLRNLARHAFSTGLRLRDDTREALVASAKQHPLQVRERLCVSFSELAESAELRSRTAMATVLDSSRIDIVQRIAADSLLVGVITEYLGYRPCRVSPRLFWSPANDLSDAQRESAAQTVLFHYDVHHYNFAYVNFYLFDTDRACGAHVLIDGSHREKRLRHLFGPVRISDAQALRDYGPDRIRVMEGRAGEGFFEDTLCYHKALAPAKRDRLMLQLRYQ
jgi:hypothetical protein